jgi:hypothetical protein
MFMWAYVYYRPIPWASLIRKLTPICSDVVVEWTGALMTELHSSTDRRRSPTRNEEFSFCYCRCRREAFSSIMGRYSSLRWDGGPFFRAAKLRHCGAQTGLPVDQNLTSLKTLKQVKLQANTDSFQPATFSIKFSFRNRDWLTEWAEGRLSMYYWSRKLFRRVLDITPES